MKKLLIVIIIAFFALTKPVAGQTEISNKQTVSGTWSKSNSPYIVNGEAVIPEGQTLTIEAGTTVMFRSSGDTEYPYSDFDYNSLKVGFLRINGKLIAEGTANSLIVFTRNSQGYWGNLSFSNTADKSSVLKFCKFEYAYHLAKVFGDLSTEGAVSFFQTEANIENCIFVNNKNGIDCRNAKPQIINCTVVNNAKNGVRSRGENDSPVILNSIFWGNKAAVKIDNTLSVSTASVSFSLVQGEGFCDEVKDLGWNIFDTNPQFVDVSSGNFNLTSSSPCLKTGKQKGDMGAFVNNQPDLSYVDVPVQAKKVAVEDNSQIQNTTAQDNSQTSNVAQSTENQNTTTQNDTPQNTTAAQNETNPPVITIMEGTERVNTASKKVVGRVTDDSKVESVEVNSVPAEINNGTFSASILLKPGKNEVTVIAIDIYKNQATKTFTVEREAAKVVQKDEDNEVGKYYAILIAVQDYTDSNIKKLEGPVSDAKKLQNALMLYKFDSIIFMPDAGRSQILDTFEELSKKVTKKDNVLIFYAGHGYFDKQRDQGYWLPVDAKKSARSTWITNSDIRDNIKAIDSRHTLLIADACFSGGIFKATRSLWMNADQATKTQYSLPSRKAMTAGTLMEVPDKSVFLEYLVKRLEDNDAPTISAGSLYNKIKEPVANNSEGQNPQFGVIDGAGDEGGDFIFFKKP